VQIAVSFLDYSLVWLETLGESLSRQKVEPAVPLARRLAWSRSMPEAAATPHRAGLCRYFACCEHRCFSASLFDVCACEFVFKALLKIISVFFAMQGKKSLTGEGHTAPSNMRNYALILAGQISHGSSGLVQTSSILLLVAAGHLYVFADFQ